MNEKSSSEDTHWAQLVCITDTNTPPFLIGKNQFTIGRAPGCDICHKDNKLVSGHHCYIFRDESDKVWLYDTSTNGTLFNASVKLCKGECRQIDHGDEFYIIYKKGEESLNVGYVYQDLQRLQQEAEEEEQEADQTLKYDCEQPPLQGTIADDRLNQPDNGEQIPVLGAKRRHQLEQSWMPAKKQPRCEASDTIESEPVFTSGITTTATTCSTAVKANSFEKTQPAMDTEDEAPSENRLDKDSKAVHVGTALDDKVRQIEEDAFASTLTCIICQDLLHDCISLQPCMHSFCAGCYSDWMSQSKECPSCRSTVERINKNHIVNSLVEAYLKEHPDKQRPEDDIKALDAKNKISRDMLYASKRHDSSDYSDSDNEEDRLPQQQAPPVTGSVFGFGTPFFGVTSFAYRAVCRQCPGAPCDTVSASISKTASGSSGDPCVLPNPAVASTSNNNNSNVAEPSGSSGPSTGGGGAGDRDQKTLPEAPCYQCAVNQNHVLCQCCLQIFPDRRAEHLQNPDLPPQQCTVCYRAFCHAYWGCHKVDCNGCLAKFKDLNFGKKALPALILDNPYESQVFQNYLETKGLAVRDVLMACITKMEAGAYTCPDQSRYNINGQTPLCYACGLRNFKSLAYLYRYDLPQDELPAEVTARPNCYWGKNCRTQRNKPAHAQRFNHICDQTRV